MRKIDRKKTAFQKAAQTINFEVIVLKRLNEIANRDGTTISNLVNAIVRRSVLSDKDYWRHIAQEYNMKFQEALYMIKIMEDKENEGEMRDLRKFV